MFIRTVLLAVFLGVSAELPAQTAAERVEAGFWESIRASSDPADFRAYLEQYPNGRFVTEARERLAAATKAPGAAQQAPDRLPRAGDEWTYRLVQPKRVEGPKERNYNVKVTSVANQAITEQFAADGAAAGEWTHKGENQVVSVGVAWFSPYLLAFGGPPLSGSFGRRVPVVDPACGGSYICEASARMVTSQTIRVPAGTFDCIKVEVEQSWRPAAISGQFGAQLQGGRKMTIWYAYATKRAVKVSSRATFGVHPPIETDYDLELISYKLN